MTIVTKPHDYYFKTCMNDLRIATDFLKNHLPKKILDAIDLSTIALRHESFVDQHLSEKITDILYSVNYVNNPCYLYVLSEHQSQPDPLLAFRILSYVVRIMDFHITKLGHKKLPLVVPLVFYNGEQKYPYSTDIFDSFEDPLLLAREFMFTWFKLIDIGQIDDEQLRAHQWAAIMEMMMKHVRSREILNCFASMVKPMKILVFHNGERYIIETANYLLHAGEIEDENQLITLVQEGLSIDTGEKIMTIAEKLLQRGRQEGRHEGRHEGLEAGKHLAQQNMVEQLLKEKIDPQLIMRITNLSLDEIQKLQETVTID